MTTAIESPPPSARLRSTAAFMITFAVQIKVGYQRGLYVVGSLPQLAVCDVRQNIKLI